MGNDISLMASNSQATTGDLYRHEKICVSQFSWRVAVLCLACFRAHDLRDHADLVRPKDVYQGPDQQYTTTLERALFQLEEGVGVLMKTFSDLADLDRVKDDSMQILRGCGKKFVHLELWQCSGSESFDLMMQHCILGFTYPACKIYYDREQVARWDRSYLPPASSGIMNWAGALRRLGLWENPECLTDEERMPSYDAADGKLLLPGETIISLAFNPGDYY